MEGMEDEDMKKETQNLAYPPAFKLGEHQPRSLCSVDRPLDQHRTGNDIRGSGEKEQIDFISLT